MLTWGKVHFEAALNVVWFVLGVIALASTIRAAFHPSAVESRTPAWLHVVGVALIVAALFPYISATDDVLRIEHFNSQQNHHSSKQSQNDDLMRLYEAMDSPLVCRVSEVALTFFFISLVFTPVEHGDRPHRAFRRRAVRRHSRANPLIQPRINFQGGQMQRQIWRLYIGLLFAAGCLAQTATPPRALTWQETQEKFRANNPTLLAGQVTIDEARADEITAYLRPNPDLDSSDGTQITPFNGNPYRPIRTVVSLLRHLSYLHERRA